MSSGFAVVDLFAGPGGLAEGFSAVRAKDGSRPFRIALSVEMERAAHSTLLLRSFLRQFADGPPDAYYSYLNTGGAEPNWQRDFPHQWAAAEKEALRLTLGGDGVAELLNPKLDEIRERSKRRAILIGGPPCQAYSLAGRARNQSKDGYVAEKDHRHRLYEQYVQILERLEPAAFVMENVKGMLSSSLDGSKIFGRVLRDLRAAGGEESYNLIALGAPTARQQSLLDGTSDPASGDFIIRAEDFGLPQARHRVIVVGIRRDIYSKLTPEDRAALKLTRQAKRVGVRDVIGTMPSVRSGLSRADDTSLAWRKVFQAAADALLKIESDPIPSKAGEFHKAVARYMRAPGELLSRSSNKVAGVGKDCPPALSQWLIDEKLTALANHETRGHMASDLARYMFAAIYGELTGRSPKATDYPKALAPDHANWDSGKFADRFRVQLFDNPSTTVTSHIAKDGHYFIHPDPSQCRSLTVREAARLQTFPDNYYFKGNRTEQFTQVGNAVPPFLAKQIGDVLHAALAAASPVVHVIQDQQTSPEEPDRRKARAWRKREFQSRSEARRAGFRRR
ncbi:Modification methylase BspRI [compost metagenome]